MLGDPHVHETAAHGQQFAHDVADRTLPFAMFDQVMSHERLLHVQQQAVPIDGVDQHLGAAVIGYRRAQVIMLHPFFERRAKFVLKTPLKILPKQPFAHQ